MDSDMASEQHSAVSAGSFLEWSEQEVQAWLVELGYGQYGDKVTEESITGDTLPYLTPESLIDLGITSIGHRLGILKAIYTLKVELSTAAAEDGDRAGDLIGWDWSEDDWRPMASESLSFHQAGQSGAQSPYHHPASIASNPALSISQQSFHNAERAPHQLHRHQASIASTNKSIASSPTTHSSENKQYVESVSAASDRDKGLEERLWDMIQEQNDRISGLERDVAKLMGIGLEKSQIGLRNRQRSTDRLDNVDEEGSTLRAQSSGLTPRPYLDANMTPSVLSPSFIQQPPSDPSHSTAAVAMGRGVANSSIHATPPALTRMMTSTALVGNNLSTPTFSKEGNSTHVVLGSSSTPGTARGTPGNLPLSAETLSGTHPSRSGSRLDTVEERQTADSAQKKARDAAGRVATGFRVTLEDPCWKVLPAALKKYKIDDDWKDYAMFLCYASTERCLSYDEKPLILFQKLKESGQKPVFMLRHIRDVKSPLAIAANKEATRRAVKPAASGGSSRPGTSSSLNSTSLASQDTRLHHPPLLQPISEKARAAQGMTKDFDGSAYPDMPSPGLRGDSVKGQTEGEVKKTGYAIAIYPYIAERDDEFDVIIGSAFIILDKARGWWVVQKDPQGTGDVPCDKALSGWVPAGCLLETFQPVGPATIPSGPDEGALAKESILPGLIVSTSFQGLALMEYIPKGEHELRLQKEERLRVFKRYAHWSYTVKENGERGWVPSWFIGKRNSEVAKPSGASIGELTDKE